MSLTRFLLHHPGQRSGREAGPESDRTVTCRRLGRRTPEILAVLAETCSVTTPAPDLNETLEALRIETLRGQLQAMPGAAALLAFAAQSTLPDLQTMIPWLLALRLARSTDAGIPRIPTQPCAPNWGTNW